MQNGYGAEDIARKIVGNRCIVLRAITSIGTERIKPGLVRYHHSGKTIIEKSKASIKIIKMLNDSGLESIESKDIKKDIWRKLIANCMANPITALFNIKNKEITNQNLRPIAESIGKECIRVAKKDGVYFDEKTIDEILGFISKSENMSSMLQDIRSGRKTEIDFLNGVIVALGKKYGIECPTNAAIVSMIHYLQSRQSPSK